MHFGRWQKAKPASNVISPIARKADEQTDPVYTTGRIDEPDDDPPPSPRRGSPNTSYNRPQYDNYPIPQLPPSAPTSHYGDPNTGPPYGATGPPPLAYHYNFPRTETPYHQNNAVPYPRTPYGQQHVPFDPRYPHVVQQPYQQQPQYSNGQPYSDPNAAYGNSNGTHNYYISAQQRSSPLDPMSSLSSPSAPVYNGFVHTDPTTVTATFSSQALGRARTYPAPGSEVYGMASPSSIEGHTEQADHECREFWIR
ncbi:hypothetical protein K504DRAFT_106347 [Pleomassaria siparia CBS 279.74]|uniref:Uncharacterized protein n=1 Tax=Pleomassaria siparia CBS 279.74 TaxID=1314801 RepID=A0A6G1JXS9_9PLEO|nr:hypothetical protein K504DRAFT_106347 [Pleomassaria siparia CBS 279.74]